MGGGGLGRRDQRADNSDNNTAEAEAEEEEEGRAVRDNYQLIDFKQYKSNSKS